MTPSPSPREGRLLIAAAACLWSLNGLFMKLLTQPNVLGLGEPPVSISTIAFSRVFIAALVMAPLVPWRNLRWRPAMGAMAICFAVLNLLFVWALGRGTAANALVLQYTAPVWILLIGYMAFGERPGRLDTVALAIAMAGLAVIVGNALLAPTWSEVFTVVIGIGSGVAYGAVVICLRYLRSEPGAWLTFQNFAAAALAALPLAWHEAWPRWDQAVTLALFGAVQLGFPYLLMSKGLRSVSSQEAAMICLLEPLLSPAWAYLVSGEVPETATFVGGALILGALVFRYWPRSPCATDPNRP
jgi:DME family drug/metabolite transporter